MLFDVKNDPHELHDLAASRPDLCAQGAKIIFEWQNKHMAENKQNVDPLWTVLKEGGPLHSRGKLTAYKERLKKTGRGGAVAELDKKYPGEG